jgi:hypothetical protein
MRPGKSVNHYLLVFGGAFVAGGELMSPESLHPTHVIVAAMSNSR